MALSLATFCSFRLSALKAHRNDSPYPPKKLIQPKATSHCPISFTKGHINVQNCFKLAYGDSHLQKATSFRANTKREAARFDSPVENTGSFIKILYHFFQPFPIAAATVQLFFVLARVWKENSHLVVSSPWSMLIKTIGTFVVINLAQGFANGMNQIFDIGIDKINKPYLPLASGELSVEHAWLMELCFLCMGIPLAQMIGSGPFLFAMAMLIILAFTYNCPPFRWKHSTYGAVFSNALSQGIVMVFCTHASARNILGLPFQLRPAGIFMCIFGAVFAAGWGFEKDVPDYEGDVKHNVPTIASKLGVKVTTRLAVTLVVMNYVGGILAAIYMPQAFKRTIVIPAHILQALILIFQVWRNEKANYAKEGRVTLHVLGFVLFHLEYLIYLLM